MSTTAEEVDRWIDELSKYEFDPLGFVESFFPWGEVGTPLAKEEGPEEWQRAQLRRMGDQLRDGGDLGAVVREAVSAGHGVGKSGLVSWIVLWAVSTREDTRGVVTANTAGQLQTKTWAELAKWHKLFTFKELFTLTATAIYSADPERKQTWRIDAVPWTKENTEAFAGLHNKGSRVLLIFDEASAIDDTIWEVAEGALTDADTQIIWCAYGNPTRTTGRFHKVCTRPGAWTYNRVDSRTVRFTNKAQIAEWVKEYGEDSDFVRVRVKGQFPRAGFANFISPELTEGARVRELSRVDYAAYPKVLAIDPARFGDDDTVITLRQGRKVHWQVSMSGYDGVDVGGRVFDMLTGDSGEMKAQRDRRDASGVSCIVYDANGNGADLDSTLRRIGAVRGADLPPLIAVNWGVPAKDEKKYFNQRSECWGHMRDWLANGEIPDDDQLADQLTSLDYGYDGLFRIQLQSKQDIKKNGGKSPDKADSLALTFIPELIDRKIVVAKVRPVVQRRKVVWSGRIPG